MWYESNFYRILSQSAEYVQKIRKEMLEQAKDLPNMNGRINRTLDLLGNSAFRSRFKLDKKDLHYIREKGIDTIRRHAFDFITSRISDRFPRVGNPWPTGEKIVGSSLHLLTGAAIWEDTPGVPRVYAL